MFGFFMRTGRPPSDLAAHFELPYMKAFLAVLPEVLEGEMDLRHCSMVTKIAETV
jgi:quinol monooxygenase YgiN